MEPQAHSAYELCPTSKRLPLFRAHPPQETGSSGRQGPHMPRLPSTGATKGQRVTRLAGSCEAWGDGGEDHVPVAAHSSAALPPCVYRAQTGCSLVPRGSGRCALCSAACLPLAPHPLCAFGAVSSPLPLCPGFSLCHLRGVHPMGRCVTGLVTPKQPPLLRPPQTSPCPPRSSHNPA